MSPDHPSTIVPDRTGLYRPLEQSYRFCDIHDIVCPKSSTPDSVDPIETGLMMDTEPDIPQL